MAMRMLALSIGFAAAVIGIVACWLVARSGFSATIGSLDHSPGYFEDFRIYYEQARELRAGAPRVIEGWVYPPVAALPFLPISGFERSAANGIWAAVQLGLAVWLAMCCARYLRSFPRWQRYVFGFGLVFSSLPVVHGAKWGQLSVFIALATIVGLETKGWRGISLFACAASLKLYPLGCAGLYVIRGERRTLAWVVAAVVVLSAPLPIAMFGYEQTLRLWTACFHSAWKLAQESSLSSQSLSVAVDKWFAPRGVVAGSPGPLFLELPGVARAILTWLGALALLGATLYASVRRRRADVSLDAVSWLLCSTILLKPGWFHYFSLLPLAHALVLQHAPTARTLSLCALSWLLCAVPLIASLSFPPFFFVAEYFGVVTIAAICGLAALWSCDPRDATPPAQPQSGTRRSAER